MMDIDQNLVDFTRGMRLPLDVLPSQIKLMEVIRGLRG